MNIYLIGYRGTGKSSVAPRLAKLLGEKWSWLDLDVALEERSGRTIAEIFREQGEEHFRDLEQAELAHASRLDWTVVATGGGIIGREANRQLLREGWVTWLTAPPEVIQERVNADSSTSDRRPNLTTRGGLTEIQRLLTLRTPLYRELADFTIETHQSTVEAIVEQIADAWRTCDLCE